jgi:hypothetical protein
MTIEGATASMTFTPFFTFDHVTGFLNQQHCNTFATLRRLLTLEKLIKKTGACQKQGKIDKITGG